PRSGGVPLLDHVPHPPRLSRLGARVAAGRGGRQPHHRRPGRRRAGPTRAGADARREAGHGPRRRGAPSMTATGGAPTRTQVLVIGSGIAGLTAALRASRTADVLLVTKGLLTDGATSCAQGGIAGAVGPGD